MLSVASNFQNPKARSDHPTISRTARTPKEAAPRVTRFAPPRRPSTALAPVQQVWHVRRGRRRGLATNGMASWMASFPRCSRVSHTTCTVPLIDGTCRCGHQRRHWHRTWIITKLIVLHIILRVFRRRGKVAGESGEKVWVHAMLVPLRRTA